MNRLKFAIIIALIAPCLAPAFELKPLPNGVDLMEGANKLFTVQYPALLNADKKPAGKIVEVRLGEKGAQVSYDSGAIADISIDGETMSIRFEELPESVVNFRLTANLGFSALMGAEWQADYDLAKPFPEIKPEKPHLFQGHIRHFLIRYANGDVVNVKVPEYSYVQLTDYREWNNNKNFALSCFSPVRREDRSLFTFSGPEQVSSATEPKSNPQVLIDEFGQYTRMDWPLKVQSADELKADVEEEKTYYNSFTPPPLDLYGGLPGSKEQYGFEATGFFHVEKIEGRWYMVDPLGNWFFQLGVCSFAPYTASTYYKGRENLYEEIPAYDSEFRTAYGQNADGKRDGQFNFLVANRIRKYGQPYDPYAFTSQMIERVRKFGFNSTGAFGSGDYQAREEASFPYVASPPLAPWKGVPQLSRGIWDPFDEKVRAIVERQCATLKEKADDPLLIGYFLSNEPLFESISTMVPGFDETKACKRRLVQMLEEKYHTIGAFNQAWGTELDSFAQAKRQGLPITTSEASEDMEAYQNLFLEEYFSFLTAAIRKNDPNHMILGCRLQSGTINNEDLCRIGAKYCDVWSFNYYTYGIDKEFLNKIYAWTDRPMLLSEFYWNSFSDSGVSGGVKDVNSQQERGLAYRNYVELAVSLPFIVGVEWFTLLDASQTGVGFSKYNGENPNSGLFSVTDRPWKPMIAEMIKTNYDIYQVGASQREAFVYDDSKFKVDTGRMNTVLALRIPSSLNIDGSGNDWPGVPAELISSNRLVQGKAAGDFSASFKAAWDKNCLYILVDISDITPAQNQHEGRALWRADGIELFIGTEHLGKGGQLLFSDRQILVGATSDKSSLYYAHSPEQYDGQSALAVRPGGYLLEVAIPWQALGVQPTDNTELLFDIGVNDSLDGQQRDKQLMWNGTNRNSGDRSNWGRLRLTGHGDA